MTDTPRAYIGCLASYNAGRHHGRWLDLDCEDTFNEQLKSILDTAPVPDAEELWVFDTEGLPVPGEMSPSEALKYGLIVSLCRDEQIHDEVVSFVLDKWDSSEPEPDTVLTRCQEVWRGSASTPGEWAEEYWGDCMGDIPAELAHYIDWERYAKSMEHAGDIRFIQVAHNEYLVVSNH